MFHSVLFRLFWALPVVVAVLLSPGVRADESTEPEALAAEPLRVLFVGNSYTAYFAMPTQFSAMCEHAEIAVEVEKITRGGWSWKRHWEDGPAPELIRDGEWDVVVLQDRSRAAMDQPEAFDEFGEKFVALVQSTGARPVLYLTWAREHLPQEQRVITGKYAALAERTGASVAPVGAAWQHWFAELPEVPLHRKDRSHPNRMGAYLSACVMFATITGESPLGQVHVIAGRDVVEKTEMLVEILAEDAEALQRCAWEAVQAFDLEEAAAVFEDQAEAESVLP